MPRRLLYPLATSVASIMYLVMPEARRNAKENMRRVLGPGSTRWQINKATWQAFHNLGRYGADFVRDHRKLEGRITFSGWEHLDNALADGKGAILVGLHMGSWELGAMTIAKRRYPMNVLVDKVYTEGFSKWVQKMRSKFGMKVIAVNDGTPRMFRALRNNELLAILVDAPKHAKLHVNFCNSRAKAPGGPAALALRTGAKIIPAGVFRASGNKFKGWFQEPLSFEPSGDFKKDVQELTQRIMDTLEQTLKTHPEQWFMFRKMWA